MRRHDGGQAREEPIGFGVAQHLFGGPVVARQRRVAVRLRPAVAGEVLAAGGHAGLGEPVDEASRVVRHERGGRAETAVSDHARAAVVDVEHGGEGHVDPRHAQFVREHDARGAIARGDVRTRCEFAHRRNLREAFAKALHAAAFVVDRDDDPRAALMNRSRQFGELIARRVVAREKDHHPDERMFQEFFFPFGERRPFEVDAYGAEASNDFLCRHVPV